MMSIVKVHPARNLFEQVKWKCKALSSLFSTIILVHVIFGFLTADGTGSFSIGGSFVALEARTYTLDGAFIYSVVLMLGIGWMLASQALSHDQQSIVTNNQTEVLSTFFFMVILSIFTFVSACLMFYITVALETLKISEPLIIESFLFSFTTMLLFVLCMLLAGSLGYFIRVVFQFSKLLLVLLFVLLFLVIRTYGVDTWHVVFGSTTVSIIWRSSVYILLFWGASFAMRLRREVSRS